MNTRVRPLAAIVLVALVTSCGKKAEEPGAKPETSPLPTAATLGDQVVLDAADYLAREPYAGADRSRGEKQAMFCRACHSLEKNGANMIGPALFGFFGSKAGTRSGFEYSAVMRNADFTWTPEALDAWLAQPGRFLPGNRMTFAGIARQADRDDLIAYLLEVTTEEQ